MADKTKTKDQGKGPVDATYDIAAFMVRYEVTPSEAQTIIRRYGPARKKLDAYMAARNF